MRDICSRRDQLTSPSAFYPLHAWICRQCLLVQLDAVVAPEEIFTRVRVFLVVLRQLGRPRADLCRRGRFERFGLGQDSRIVEIASNDGYLLQHFVARGLDVLGIEPAANVAKVAETRGIPTRVQFFGRAAPWTSEAERGRADLLIGNNVLAHVPDLNDFVAGMKELLSPDGAITMEFPHLVQLIEHSQFDTIYHEHFSLLLVPHRRAHLRGTRPENLRRRRACRRTAGR